MKKLYFTLLISLLVKTTIFSQTAPITFSLPTTKFCPGQIFPLEFTFDPTLAGHTFQVQLSNSSGSFDSGVSVLGNGTSSPISCTMISTSTTSTSLYKVRIIDSTVSTNISEESVRVVNYPLSSSFIYIADTLDNVYANLTLCIGSRQKFFTKLNASDSYGATYQWKNSSNPSTILGTQYKYIVNQSGYYTVTFSKPGCASATSSSLQISYSSTISPTFSYAGELHCIGTTVPAKTSYNSETVVYEWRKDGIIMPNVTSGKYDITTSGIYNLRVRDQNCSYSSEAPIKFSNNVPIQIIGKDTVEICNGSSVTLSADANLLTGNTIEWFRDGQSISPNNRFLSTFTTATPGVYTVKLKEGNCASVSNPVTIKTVLSFNPVIKSNLETTTCVISPILTSDIPFNFNGQIQ
jgi:hypothetical protein